MRGSLQRAMGDSWGSGNEEGGTEGDGGVGGKAKVENVVLKRRGYHFKWREGDMNVQ